jgi:hypothetical protein
VKDLISNNGVVRDKSARDKGTLVFAYDVGKDHFKPVSNGFSDDFQRDITQGDGSVLTWVGGFVSFWYKANMGIIIGLGITTIV